MVPFTATAEEATTPVATETEDAIFIADAGYNNLVSAMIPVDIPNASGTGNLFTGVQYFKLVFKCKSFSNDPTMLTPTLTIMRVLKSSEITSTLTNKTTTRELSWASRSDVTIENGICTAYFKVDFTDLGRYNIDSRGYRSFYINIGNAEYDNNGCDESGYRASYIMSDIKLYTCDDLSGTNTGTTNYLPEFNASNIDFNGTYFFKGNNCSYYNSPYAASSMKWHVTSRPQYVKHIKVPKDYNTSTNYDAGNFTLNSETDYTREYYTNPNYSDLHFAKLDNSYDSGFEVITEDLNKKMIIIDANHEGEEDYTGTGSERQPSYNKAANIFIPISYAQYFMDRTGNPNSGTSLFINVKFNAKRLEGDGAPVLGRIVGKPGSSSQTYAKGCLNATNGDYFSNPVNSHNVLRDSDGSTVLNCTYNPETGEYSGWMRVRAFDGDYTTVWGTDEVLTIGNSEHNAVSGKALQYDSTAFNSSFAISDIQIDVYMASGSGPYTKGDLLATDIAPDLYADNIDEDSRWAFKDINGTSYHNDDPIRASQYQWSREGNVGMVHSEDLTVCMKENHTLTYNARTETTCEYYSCAACGKNYATAYGKEEISDVSETDKMIVVEAVGNNSANVFIPVKLGGFTDNKLFKFTCKVKCMGDEIPTVSTIRPVADGSNKADPTYASSKNGMAVYDYSYDKETQILTAYIKAWISPNYYKTSNTYTMYQRYNPISSANLAIVIGNTQLDYSSTKDGKTHTAFAITDPALYALDAATFADGDESKMDVVATAKAANTTGENLIAPITDKTVDFDSTWSTTLSDANNPTAAPLNVWGKVGGFTSRVSAVDIPNGFFEGTEDPAQMLQILGASSEANQNAIHYETFLEQGATYQFDIDYRAYGGVTARIDLDTANSSSYSDAALTETSANVDGSHKSVQFTMADDARYTSGGNFRFYLGQQFPIKRNGSVYFANVSLRKVTGGVLGENILLNGNFNYGDAAVLTDNNYDDILTFWDNDSILNYTQAQIMNIPTDFFTGDATWAENIALKYSGGDWNELRFKVQLEADTTYRLTYNYRGVGDLPTIDTEKSSETTGSVSINDLGSTSNGQYLQTYELTTSADKTAGDSTQVNTTVRLKFGVDSADKAIYIANVKLHKVVNGEIVGTNLVGHLNPIVDTTSDVEFDIAGDDAISLTRGFAQGWLSSKEVKASLITVEDDFFNIVDNATKRSELREMLLKITDIFKGPDTDTNNDTAVDICDLVYMKNVQNRKATGTNYSGADDLEEKIMNASNTTIADTSKVYYVSSKSGSDNNSGTSSKPFATITKAISSVGNKTGYTILLERGSEFRIPTSTRSSADSFVIPSGTTLGAYGTGDKPVIYGSVKNYGVETTWTKDSTNSNVWYTTIVSTNNKHDANIPGNIYFFNSVDSDEPTVIGSVSKNGDRFTSISQLSAEGEFYISGITKDNFDGKIYVYCDQNPSEKYGRIEIAEKRDILFMNDNTTNVTIDNIAVKFGGGHGINARACNNITITNCEVGYMGGAPLEEDLFGNGIQFGQGGTNLTIENCYVYQCCDAGITFQSWSESGYSDTTEFKNVTFKDNLLTNNFYNIEFFTTATQEYGKSSAGNGKFTDITISGNIMRYAGDCWSYDNRLGDGNYRCANICVTKNAYYINTSNLNIVDNVFDCTMGSQIYWTWDNVTANLTDDQRANHVGLNISGNSYYQKAGAADSRVMMFGDTSSYDYASSLYGLEKSVRAVDSAPSDIIWLDTIP